MAKIDTSKIEGYEDMTAEEKLAALEAFEYEDHGEELKKQKDAVTKANREAAEWKRKHNALLTDEGKAKNEQAEQLANMQKELEALRLDKKVAEFKAKYVAQGYDEALAEDTAKALADGDSAKVFANQAAFLKGYAQQVKAEALKKTPRPGSGGDGGPGVDYAKKREEALQRGDMTAATYYTRLIAQDEAEAGQE